MSLLTPFIAPRDWFQQSVNDMLSNELDTTTSWPLSNRSTMISPVTDRSPRRRNAKFISLNVMETDKAYLIHCEIPGVPKEDITLHVENNYLKIRAKKEDCQTHLETPAENITWHHKEIIHGADTRFVHLPSNVDQDSVKCFFKDGTLHITYMKKNITEGVKKIYIM